LQRTYNTKGHIYNTYEKGYVVYIVILSAARRIVQMYIKKVECTSNGTLTTHHKGQSKVVNETDLMKLSTNTFYASPSVHFKDEQVHTMKVNII